MKNLAQTIFFKRFFRYLLVGSSLLTLLAFFFQVTPSALLAEDDGGNDACQGTVVARNVSAGGETSGQCRIFDLGQTCRLPQGWLIDSSCPQNSPSYQTGQCTAFTTVRPQCSGQQLCDTTVTQTADCASSVSGPYNCRYVPGQCNYNPSGNNQCDPTPYYCPGTNRPIYRDPNRSCNYDYNQCSSVCIQVITPARNPYTGECREFPTPCDVPSGWNQVLSCNNQCRSINCVQGAPVGCYYTGQITYSCDPNQQLTCGQLVCSNQNIPVNPPFSTIPNMGDLQQTIVDNINTNINDSMSFSNSESFNANIIDNNVFSSSYGGAGSANVSVWW